MSYAVPVTLAESKPPTPRFSDTSVRAAAPLGVSAAIAVFNASPSARPGEAISLQGHFSATAEVYLAPGTSELFQRLAVAQTSDGLLKVQSFGQVTVLIPSTLPFTVYRLYIKQGGQRSPYVYVNRAAGMQYDSPDVIAGGTVRLFGRNLCLGPRPPRIRFVRRDTGASTPTTLGSFRPDPYQVVVRAPATLAVGKVYDVYVSNGYGGAAGETKVEQPLQVIAAGTNPYGLPVGWGHKFTFTSNVYNVRTDARLRVKAVGDGVANDREVIQDAMNRAAADGGGVVYLPAGTYKLLPRGWGGLEMRSRVMVVGAGMTKTSLQFGSAGSGQGVHVDPGTKTFGLADLTLQNVTGAGPWETSFYGVKGTEFIMQRVRWKLALSRRLEVESFNKVCILNCEFTQGNTWAAKGYAGTVRLDGSKNIVFANNKLTFATGGLALNFTPESRCENVVLENNEIYRDGSARWTNTREKQLVNHLASFEFSRNVVNLNNVYKVINGDPQNINDGEAIIAEQGANYHPDESVGTATSATSRTLTDKTQAWPATFKQQGIAVGVSIVHGKGMGQWRRITSRTATTLTLATAWDIVPDATSRYSIHVWGAENWLVQGNRLENNQRGITLYFNASRNIALVDNELTNSGSIDITPASSGKVNMKAPDSSVTKGVYPIWNVQAIHNSVADISGKMGVFIGVHTIQYVNPRTFGTTAIGFEARRNTVIAHIPNVVAQVDAPYPNGFIAGVFYQSAGANYHDEGIPVVLGSIFQDNTAINCDNALSVNTGSYNTLVKNLQLRHTGRTVANQTLEGTTHAAVRTVVLAK